MDKEKPHYHGHRARLKQRFAQDDSVEKWPEYEFLELALTYCIPRGDVKPVAKELTSRFGGFAGALDADADALETVPGIGQNSIQFLRFLRDASRRYVTAEAVKQKDLLSSPAAVHRYLAARLKGESDEEFHAVFLDAGNRLITAKKLQRGTVNASAVYPRAVAESALKLKAVGVIIAHNHPGGTPNPSDDDRRATAAVRNALEAIEVSLLDHIIITASGYFSWRENGLL